MHDKSTFLNLALEAGARGYLLKNGKMNELYATIKDILGGEIIIGTDIGLK